MKETLIKLIENGELDKPINQNCDCPSFLKSAILLYKGGENE